MSERTEELLEEILAELKVIAEDVAYIKANSDLSDASEIVEAIGQLGSKLTGEIGGSLGSDLNDVTTAISSLETTIDLK